MITFEEIPLLTNFDNPVSLEEKGVGDKSSKVHYFDLMDEDGAVKDSYSTVAGDLTVVYSTSNIISFNIPLAIVNLLTLNEYYYGDLKRIDTTENFICRIKFKVQEGYSDSP